jgi:dolichyl-phosphate-mannose--protein O-mannosyl transferase
MITGSLWLPRYDGAVQSETVTAAARLRRFTHRRWFRWAGPVAVTAIAAILRLWNLGAPRLLVSDEYFYVRDAWTMTQLGYEGRWPSGHGDTAFDEGRYHAFTSTAEFVAHPPFGKWIISLGISLFGVQNPVSWRITTAVIGVLAVILLMLIAYALFHSRALATTAGLLFAIDGNAIVMSRIALLDNSVMFFALLGFGAVLLDRRWMLARLAQWTSSNQDAGTLGRAGPSFWWRPWLIAAGLAFGLDAACKWSGFFFLAAFGIYVLGVDMLARRRAGLPHWALGTLRTQALIDVILLVPIAVATYVATWSGWFATSGGLDRQWANQPGHAWTGALAWVPHTIQSFVHVHEVIYRFGIHYSVGAPYTSPAADWLFLIRPSVIFNTYVAAGTHGCPGTESCGTEVSGIANPLIWWAASACVIFLVIRLPLRRDWRIAFILMGMVGGYLPWLLIGRPTVFQYYTIAFEPYMILALTVVIALILRIDFDSGAAIPLAAEGGHSRIRVAAVSAVIACFVIMSLWFLPEWLGIQEPLWFIQAHDWFPSWS